MRFLVASLIVVTFATLIGFGWALDILFVRTLPTKDATDITVWSGLARRLATTLDKASSSEDFIANWPAQDAPLQLLPLDEFPLPEEMQASFLSGEPLTLESESGLSIQYYLPTKKMVLVLGPTHVHGEGSLLPLLFTTVFYSGVLLLLLFWIYPLIKRLLSLEQSARKFGQGELDVRVRSSGLSYIGQIEDEFNRMANRIQVLVADNKLLSSAISHELRTPIARLRFGIDALSDTGDEETQKKYINRISNDIALMEKQVNSLLSYAKLDNQLSDLKQTRLDARSLIEECLAQYSDERLDIEFRDATKGIEEIRYIEGNIDYLAILFNNLLTNALKYGKNRVRVTLSGSANETMLAVADDGPGIAVEKRADVLKPFQRIAGVTQQGFGLGLAIVARIAEAHRAELTVTSDVDLGGACFELRFRKKR